MIVRANARVQRVLSRDAYVMQHINEAYEIIRLDNADPPVQSEVRLIEGWRNGNIKVSEDDPHDIENETHTWDLWLKVEANASPPSEDWRPVIGVYVRMPT